MVKQKYIYEDGKYEAKHIFNDWEGFSDVRKKDQEILIQGFKAVEFNGIAKEVKN